MQKKKSLTVGIDEFTLVVKPKQRDDIMVWEYTVQEILDILIPKTQIENLFEQMEIAEKGLIQGYNLGLTLVNRPWFLAICWNSNAPDMGICVRFSAQAWIAYQMMYVKKYNEKTYVYSFYR